MSQRFSILLHDYPWWHWDFLLENGDHALCWRLLRQPCCGEPIAAQRLQPHRLKYLDFEGPVSQDRGVAIQVAQGSYRIVTDQPALTITMFGLDWAQQASLKSVGSNRLFWQFSACQD